MVGHVHAKLMAEYAKDAETMEAPFLEWEYYSEWNGGWSQLEYHPAWASDTKYRRKVNEVCIGHMFTTSVAPKVLKSTQYRIVTKDGWFIAVRYVTQVCSKYKYNKNTVFETIEEATFVADKLNKIFSRRGSKV